MSILI